MEWPGEKSPNTNLSVYKKEEKKNTFAISNAGRTQSLSDASAAADQGYGS